MTENFTIHFEPLPQGGQLVTVPEIDARIEITGTTLQDAQAAGLAAITAYKEQQRKKRPRRHGQRASSGGASA